MGDILRLLHELDELSLASLSEMRIFSLRSFSRNECVLRLFESLSRRFDWLRLLCLRSKQAEAAVDRGGFPDNGDFKSSLFGVFLSGVFESSLNFGFSP